MHVYMYIHISIIWYYNEKILFFHLDIAEITFTCSKHWHITINHCKTDQLKAPHVCRNMQTYAWHKSTWKRNFRVFGTSVLRALTFDLHSIVFMQRLFRKHIKVSIMKRKKFDQGMLGLLPFYTWEITGNHEKLRWVKADISLIIPYDCTPLLV